MKTFIEIYGLAPKKSVPVAIARLEAAGYSATFEQHGGSSVTPYILAIREGRHADEAQAVFADAVQGLPARNSYGVSGKTGVFDL